MDGGIHVNTERIPHPANADVLIERIIIAIVGVEPDVALAIGDLILAGRVVGHVGVRDVFDMPHQPVEYLSHLNVGFIVSRDDLTRGAVLALVVGDLLNMLR